LLLLLLLLVLKPVVLLVAKRPSHMTGWLLFIAGKDAVLRLLSTGDWDVCWHMKREVMKHCCYCCCCCRWFFQQLILAVDYCHRKGVANRDIKLENTLLQVRQQHSSRCYAADTMQLWYAV
jgi:hypothetical protein